MISKAMKHKGEKQTTLDIILPNKFCDLTREYVGVEHSDHHMGTEDPETSIQHHGNQNVSEKCLEPSGQVSVPPAWAIVL